MHKHTQHAPTKQFKSVLDAAKHATTQLSNQLKLNQQKQQQRQKDEAVAAEKAKQQARIKVG
jgi:hypothetical protein